MQLSSRSQRGRAGCARGREAGGGQRRRGEQQQGAQPVPGGRVEVQASPRAASEANKTA